MNARLAMLITARDAGGAAMIGRLRRDLVGLAKDADRAQAQFDKMGKHFKRGVGAAAGAAALAKGVKGVLGPATDLQEVMNSIHQQMSGSPKEMEAGLKRMRQTAQEVQKYTSFDAEGVARIQYQLKKAGLTVGDITTAGAAASTAKFATAHADEVSPEQATIIMTQTAAGFRSKDFKEVAELYSKASAAATTNIPKLFAGLRKAAPSAAEYGVSMRDTFAAIATMQGRGVQESVAGQTFTAFLSRLTSAYTDTKKRAKMESIGIKPFDASGNFVGLQKVIIQLRDALKGKSTAYRGNLYKDLVGEEYIDTAPSLINAGEGSIEAIQRNIAKGMGLDQKSLIRLTGEKATRESLTGNIKTVAGQIGTPLLDPLKRIEDRINDQVSNIGDSLNKSPGLNKALAYGLPAAAAGLGGYGLLQFGKAGMAAARLGKNVGGKGILQGLMGRAGGITAGVAQAKALEAAAGVQPVSVVNWPAMLSGPFPGMAPAVLPMAGGAAAALPAPVLSGNAAAAAKGVKGVKSLTRVVGKLARVGLRAVPVIGSLVLAVDLLDSLGVIDLAGLKKRLDKHVEEGTKEKDAIRKKAQEAYNQAQKDMDPLGRSAAYFAGVGERGDAKIKVNRLRNELRRDESQQVNRQRRLEQLRRRLRMRAEHEAGAGQFDPDAAERRSKIKELQRRLRRADPAESARSTLDAGAAEAKRVKEMNDRAGRAYEFFINSGRIDETLRRAKASAAQSLPKIEVTVIEDRRGRLEATARYLDNWARRGGGQ